MAGRFEIRVNQRPFELWETAVVELSLGTNAGQFQFDSTNVAPETFPVRVGDLVQVLVDDVPQVTGYVDALQLAGSTAQQEISVSGRDTTQDIIDSSVPDAAKFLEGPLTMVTLAELVIEALGANVQVIDSSRGADIVFTDDDLFNADSGKGAMEFLVDFARKKQVYLIADGAGRLSVFRPDPDNRATTPLENRRNSGTNNVKEFRVEFKSQDRFNVYSTRSQGQFSFGDGDYEGDDVDLEGTVTDDEIRVGRYLEVQGEESMFLDEVDNRAEEEANLRRSRSVIYEATVAGLAQEDGSLWQVGQRVKVNDDFADLRGFMLVSGVRFAVSVREGTRTRLTCTPSDAYQARGIAAGGDARKSSLGSRFVTQPSTTPRLTFFRGARGRTQL